MSKPRGEGPSPLFSIALQVLVIMAVLGRPSLEESYPLLANQSCTGGQAGWSKVGRGGAPARDISFVSLVAYGPKVSDSALTMGVTASETRQGSSQQRSSTSVLEHLHFYTLFTWERKLLLSHYYWLFCNTPEPNSYKIWSLSLRVADSVDLSRSVKLIFTRGHISLEVAFKGPNVMLGLYKCNYSLTVKWELGSAIG